MDPRVIDIPYFQRTLLVKGIIARTRAPKSAKVYETIWDKETGSPLMHYSILQRDLLQEALGEEYHVELAMRYQNPSIEAALKKNHILLSDLNVEMQIGSTEGIKQYVQNSDAAAFLSVHTITRELAANQLMIVDIRSFEMMRTLQFISLHGRISHVANVFQSFCLSRYNK